MLELPFPEHVPGGVEHARLMFLRPPVDTRKPCQLQVEPPVCRVERARPDACRSLYWRSTAQTPHRASIGGWPPGHVSPPGARDTGDAMVAPGGLPNSARSSREVIRKSTGDRRMQPVSRRRAPPGGRRRPRSDGRRWRCARATTAVKVRCHGILIGLNRSAVDAGSTCRL